MKSISYKIIQNLNTQGRGSVFTPKDFLMFGDRGAIDTALSRLSAHGKIRRLARGLYDYPKQHPLFGDLMPSLDDIATALARDTGSKLQVSGAYASHKLGLTTQVPAKIVYLTDTQTKSIKIGNISLQFKHAGTKTMAGAGKPAGVVLQALRYLGKVHINQKTIIKITQQLTPSDKQDLKLLSRYAPDWTKPTIDAILQA